MPHWPTDRYRRRQNRNLRQSLKQNGQRLPSSVSAERTHAEAPLVLAAQVGNRWEIQAVDPAAQTLGLKLGVAVADARAWVPQVIVSPFDRAADAADLKRLADWATRFSPLVAIDGGDGLMLDIAGCAHLWGSEARMLADLDRHLRSFGLHHRTAIADTIGAAWGVARFGAGPNQIVPHGQQKSALSSMPPPALRLPDELCAQLQRLGLKRIADLCALPRAALARRFGAILMDKLDQALGLQDETLSPLLPPSQCYVRMDFAEPITQRADIDRALDLLLKRLTEALRPHETGPRKLDLSCYRLDGETQRLSIGTARASLNAAHLFRLFEEKLDRLRPDDGFEAMRLSGRDLERLQMQQRDFETATATHHDLAPLIDRLSNRLGEDAVHRFETRESHVPERAVRRLPPLAESPRLHWPKAARRPIRLLPHPEPIEALAPIPDDPPVQFRWRHVLHRVRAAEGPERIAPEWWLPGEEDTEIRDYYRVEDAEGRRYWLYRAGLYQTGRIPRWFLHGLFG
ncbi:MAG: Y-family DNA polymerase [Dongiaceae bacterium]